MNCPYSAIHELPLLAGASHGSFSTSARGDNSTARLDQEVSKNPKQEIELALKRKKEHEKYDR
jgi:hypothetical protein